MTDVTVMGFIFVDIKGFAKGDYRPKERNLGQVKFVQGGVARNVAENIGGTGMNVRFVSLSDNTAIGQESIDRLRASGIDTDYIRVVDDGLGIWLVILDEGNDVAGQISRPPDTAKLEKLVDECGDEIVRNTQSIVLELDMGDSISEKVLKLAEKYGRNVYTIVGNMSVIARRPDLVKRLHCFVCNEAEIGRLIGEDLTKASWIEMLARIETLCKSEKYPAIVVTMGAYGCVYYDPATGDKGHASSRAVKIADTTGAGDAFLSGVVYGLEKGLPLHTAVEIGTDMAAKVLGMEESSCADMRDVVGRYIR